MRIFIDGAIEPVAANRNHTLLLNNNLRSNINHKLQLNNNRNNLNKNTKKKNQAGWCREDFIGTFANSTTSMAEQTTAATRSSPSPTSSLSLMSCFNQMTLSSLSTVLSSSNNEACSSSNDYSSPLSASSANKTNLFYHHRKAFRRKEDPANITIIAIEYVLLLTYTIIIPIARLAGYTNCVATIRSWYGNPLRMSAIPKIILRWFD